MTSSLKLKKTSWEPAETYMGVISACHVESLDHWFNLLWYTRKKTIKPAAIVNYKLLTNVTHKQNIDFFFKCHLKPDENRVHVHQGHVATRAVFFNTVLILF